MARKRGLRRWLKSTSKRTFVLYPLLIATLELLIHRGDLAINAWGIPLLAWGYLQYRLVGSYRVATGGGGPGLDVPPDRIVDFGPYRYVRNPMYLGHLIFMLGLALTFRSWIALGLLLFHVVWFHRRVLRDEAHLEQRFGASYLDYKRRVKRWLPGIV
jgi:hypothetical protein